MWGLIRRLRCFPCDSAVYLAAAAAVLVRFHLRLDGRLPRKVLYRCPVIEKKIELKIDAHLAVDNIIMHE
jgi:hypothetical protein